MSDCNNDFDEYSDIEYTDLTHLFWGIYPYKVSVKIRPMINRAWMRTGITYRELNRLKTEFYEKELVLTNPEDAYIRSADFGYNCFFENEQAAKQFIEDNSFFVTAVVRPGNNADVSVLSDRKVKLRKTLFCKRYRWCVTLAGSTWRENDEITLEIEDFVSQFFDISLENKSPAGDPERAFFNYADLRKLYLRDENDVVATKLALGPHVVSIEMAMLQDEARASQAV